MLVVSSTAAAVVVVSMGACGSGVAGGVGACKCYTWWAHYVPIQAVVL